MGYTVWWLRCPRCRALQGIYRENLFAYPWTKCLVCGEGSTTKAWRLLGIEYRTPGPRPRNKCVTCGALDCEVEHAVASAAGARGDAKHQGWSKNPAYRCPHIGIQCWGPEGKGPSQCKGPLECVKVEFHPYLKECLRQGDTIQLHPTVS